MTTAIVLLVLGLGFILAEVFFPSFGMLSVLATAAIVAAVALAFRESGALGIRFLIATALLVPTAIVGGLKLFPRSPLGKRMVVRGPTFATAATPDGRDEELLGKEGHVETGCRPAGMARLDGRRVNVVTRGEWIDAGERVRVLEVHGNRVVVARVDGSR
jgi:membrane-bound ClpP family serine protease